MKINETGLKNLALMTTRVKKWKQFNYCQAWTSELLYNKHYDIHYMLVKSYNTIVAVVDMDNECYYELGKWSRTTSKQQTQIYNAYFRDFFRVNIG